MYQTNTITTKSKVKKSKKHSTTNQYISTPESNTNETTTQSSVSKDSSEIITESNSENKIFDKHNDFNDKNHVKIELSKPLNNFDEINENLNNLGNILNSCSNLLIKSN